MGAKDKALQKANLKVHNYHKPEKPRTPDMCQHPSLLVPRMCNNKSEGGQVAIPPEYQPVYLYSKEKREKVGDVPRPWAYLCRQHKLRVQTMRLGHRADKDNEELQPYNAHEAECAVCQHPEGLRTIAAWQDWVITQEKAAEILGVSNHTVRGHINYYNLARRKITKDSRKAALLLLAEKGIAAPGHSPATGLRALEMLRKEEEGDTVNINVNLIDLSKLSDSQLADRAEKLAADLRREKPLMLPDSVDVEDAEILED